MGDYSNPWTFLQAWHTALDDGWNRTLEDVWQARSRQARRQAEQQRDLHLALREWTWAQRRRLVEQARHPKVVLAEIAHNRGTQ